MPAYTVTGRGQGASYGEYKPELHCGGCGCGSKPKPDPIEPIKRYCHVTVKSCHELRHVSGHRPIGLNVC